MRELVLLFVLLTALFWGYHGMAKIDNFLNDVRKDRHGQNTQKQCVREKQKKKRLPPLIRQDMRKQRLRACIYLQIFNKQRPYGVEYGDDHYAHIRKDSQPHVGDA